VCKAAQKSAHEHTGSAEAIRPSLRDGFTAYFVLSPVTGFLATVASQKNSARLDASIGASGPHDFAVRNDAVRHAHKSARDNAASTASHPAQNDDHDTPLVRDETGANKELIWVRSQAIFGKSEKTGGLASCGAAAQQLRSAALICQPAQPAQAAGTTSP
jgi:hypothetical protein